MIQNKGLIFKARPDGWPQIGKHLAVEAREFDVDAAPPTGGITTKNLYVSFDPYQRPRMGNPEAESYTTLFQPGQAIDNRGIAKVIKSDNPKFKPGDIVWAFIGTEEYSVITEEVLDATDSQVLQNPLDLDPAAYLGAMGMPGLTAYSSLYEIGLPKKGETMFVSSAAGAVGLLVGQLAKRLGLTVIGSVGDDEKLRLIKECGFDDGFNYKKEKPATALKRLAPNGIDIYYENVGGEQLEAAIDNMNTFGRIIASGMISEYSTPLNERYGIRNLIQIVSKRLTFQGFIVADEHMGAKYAKEHLENVGKWLKNGDFKEKQYVINGIDNAAEGFLGMLEGRNMGKTVVKIAEDSR